MAAWGETSPEAASAGGSSDRRDRVAAARGRAAAWSLLRAEASLLSAPFF